MVNRTPRELNDATTAADLRALADRLDTGKAKREDRIKIRLLSILQAPDQWTTAELALRVAVEAWKRGKDAAYVESDGNRETAMAAEEISAKLRATAESLRLPTRVTGETTPTASLSPPSSW